VKIEVISSYEDYFARLHRREFQVEFRGWSADYIDPQDFLEVLFQSQSPDNGSAYSNPAVDAALVDAAAEKDPVARVKKYQDIEKMILADLAGIPLYQSLKSYVLVKPYVQGYLVTPIDINIWADISVTAH
jgi:ABC-type oligopeptide transport system substrate-binding subunit